MPYFPEVEAARKPVFELIGRNVLRFQRFELLLKYLNSCSDIQVSADGPQPAAWHESRQTMGTLAGQTFTRLLVEEGTNLNDRTDSLTSSEPRIWFRWTMQLPPGQRSAAQERLKRLVAVRNRLVHRSLLDFDLQSAAGCAAALAELEQQAEDLACEEKQFRTLYESLQAVLAYYRSDQFQTQLQATMDQSQNPDDNPA